MKPRRHIPKRSYVVKAALRRTTKNQKGLERASTQISDGSYMVSLAPQWTEITPKLCALALMQPEDAIDGV